MVNTYSNRELAAIAAALEATATGNVAVSPKVSYKIIKNKNAVKQALAPFEETRDEIIKQKSGGRTTVDGKEEPQLYAEIVKAIEEISRESVNVDIVTINVSDLPETDVPIDFMNAIYFMIEGE